MASQDQEIDYFQNIDVILDVQAGMLGGRQSMSEQSRVSNLTVS